MWQILAYQDINNFFTGYSVMYDNLKIQMIDFKIKDNIKIFFEEAVRNVNVNKDSWNENKLVKDMCDAFLEDVCISLDLEKIFIFGDKVNIKYNKKEENLFASNQNVMYKLFRTSNPYERIEELCLKLKKQVKPSTWEKLMPFFLYVTSDVDVENLKNYKLDTFKKYNFLYSLGLLAGRDRENEENSISETVFNKIYKGKLKEKMDICKKFIKERCKVLKKDNNNFKCLVKNSCNYILLYDFIKNYSSNEYDNSDKIIDLLKHSAICKYMEKYERQELDEVFSEYVKKYFYYYEYIKIYNHLESELKNKRIFSEDISNELREYTSYLVLNIKKYLKEYEKRKRSIGKGHSGNFEYMREFMKSSEYGVVNKGYVVYCFNILTDWFNYSLYLHKKDINILSYNGLALKQVAQDYFCMDTGAFISYRLTNGFWEKAEKFRENIVKNVIDDWKVQDVVYKKHSELYDKMVSDELSLGNKMDFLEYWLVRFGEEDFEGENIEL